MAAVKAMFERSRARTLAQRTTSSSPSPSPPPPGSRSRHNRESFSSVKEDLEDGLPQSFLNSKTSSFFNNSSLSEAIRDEPQHFGSMATTVTMQAREPSYCCPCGHFKGWKDVKLSGQRASKSYGDLRLLGGDVLKGWEWEGSPERAPTPKKQRTTSQAPYPAGHSPLERLPVEILDQIIPLLATDLPTNGYTPRNIDLISCLLTSRTLHAATLGTLYNKITIPHSYIFSKFLQHISQYPALGTVVRRLDFSHFTSVGLGRTRRMNSEIQNLTASTLVKCLELTPRLQELLTQEHLDTDLDEGVLQKIFCGLPLLKALDFCACTSGPFRDAFETVVSGKNSQLAEKLSIERLSLHECSTLSTFSIETLLSRLPRLTHLDLFHTQVTDEALWSIPKTANLTHLNLGRCTNVTGEGVVKFLTTHPAAQNLIYLNLYSDISRHRLLGQADVENLLPKLPQSLRALNVTGAKIVSAHIPLLLPFTKHVEELGIGNSELSMSDINSLFVPAPPNDDSDCDLSMEEANWVPPVVHYLDLTGVASVTAGNIFSSKCVLLRPMTYPLQVIEFQGKTIDALKGRPTPSQGAGWTTQEFGRRGWYVRKPMKDASHPTDSGRRAWKMGASWWGMRKIPVTIGEVGGLYGHYMFKK